MTNLEILTCAISVHTRKHPNSFDTVAEALAMLIADEKADSKHFTALSISLPQGIVLAK